MMIAILITHMVLPTNIGMAVSILWGRGWFDAVLKTFMVGAAILAYLYYLTSDEWMESVLGVIGYFYLGLAIIVMGLISGAVSGNALRITVFAHHGKAE